MGIEDHLPEGFAMPNESSAFPSFWNHFWQNSVSPWDLGQPHPELVAQISSLGRPKRAYVPGCGRGHDAVFLSQAGWQVTAVDMAEHVSPHLNPQLGEDGSIFLLRDAFEVEENEVYELWWDHTFFCAIPPEKRPLWGRTVRRVLREGGVLGALVFPVGKDIAEGGPPFGMSVDNLLEVLGPGAHLVSDDPLSKPARDGGERFAIIRIDPLAEEAK